MIYHIHLKSIVYFRTHSWCCTFYRFRQMYMAYIRHYNITQNIFTALKILCYAYILPTPQTMNLFIVSIGLPFTECHEIGIIQFLAFQIGFFHLVICPQFLHVFCHLYPILKLRLVFICLFTIEL